jgi:hypothetical protein
MNPQRPAAPPSQPHTATILIVAALAATASLRAQEAVQMPGPVGSWSIGILRNPDSGTDSQTARPDTNPNTAEVQSIRVTLDGDTRRDVITWQNGRTSELWKIRDTWIGELPGGEVAALEVFGEFLPFGEWRDWNAQSLTAFTREAATREDKFHGRPAILHEKEIVEQSMPFDSFDDAPPRRFTAKFWIDPSTRLPIALDHGGTIYTFEFYDARPESLTPPEKILETLGTFERRSSVPKPQTR